MNNQHRSVSVSALALTAKVALAVCSIFALTTMASAENVATNGDIGLTAATYTVAEAAGSVTITATRSGGTTGALQVQYVTVNSSAVAGQDYTATSGTLSWASGDNADKSFTVPVANTKTTGTKAFYIRLTAVGATLMGNHTSATVDIVASSSANAPPTTKSIKQWVSCDESVDETAQFKAALAAAANNAFTLVIDCPVRFHTGYAGATPVAVPDGVTMSFTGSGELLTAGTGLTVADLSQVTFIDFKLTSL